MTPSPIDKRQKQQYHTESTHREWRATRRCDVPVFLGQALPILTSKTGEAALNYSDTQIVHKDSKQE